MQTKVGKTVHYISEIFVVKSELNVGVFHVEGKRSKARKTALAGTFYFLLRVERADVNEPGFVVIWEENLVLINEHSNLVYHLEALQLEVSSLQRKTEAIVGQLYNWKDAAHQRQLMLDQKLNLFTRLETKLQRAGFDFVRAVEELEEQ